MEANDKGIDLKFSQPTPYYPRNYYNPPKISQSQACGSEASAQRGRDDGSQASRSSAGRGREGRGSAGGRGEKANKSTTVGRGNNVSGYTGLALAEVGFGKGVTDDLSQ